MKLVTKKIQPTKRVCVRLKEAREAKGLSLSFVAAQLRMSKSHIEALEDCRFEDLPFTPMYQEKFLTSYLKLLNISCESYLAQFRLEELSQKEPVQSTEELSRMHRWYHKISHVPLILRFTGVTLVVGAFIGYLVLQIQHIVQPPELLVYSPQNGAITDDAVLRVQGKTEKEVQIQINGKQIMNTENGFFDEELTLSEGVNTIILSAKKKHGKITEETRHIIYKKERELSIFNN